MSLSTAMRGALAVVYQRLTDGELTGASGYSARTLDALQSRGLITWYLNAATWRKSVTLTAAGLAEVAGHFRYCPRCHSVVRAERKPVTVGYGPRGTRSIGEPIKAPCPCRWHADEEQALIDSILEDEEIGVNSDAIVFGMARILASNPGTALKWGQILTEHTAPLLVERLTPHARIYTIWSKIPPEDRNYSGWVMSQATLDEFAGESVPPPAVILGRHVRIDPDAQGIEIELGVNPWRPGMPAWMWP